MSSYNFELVGNLRGRRAFATFDGRVLYFSYAASAEIMESVKKQTGKDVSHAKLLIDASKKVLRVDFMAAETFGVQKVAINKNNLVLSGGALREKYSVAKFKRAPVQMIEKDKALIRYGEVLDSESDES